MKAGLDKVRSFVSSTCVSGFIVYPSGFAENAVLGDFLKRKKNGVLFKKNTRERET